MFSMKRPCWMCGTPTKNRDVLRMPICDKCYSTVIPDRQHDETEAAYDAGLL